jgi:type I restriction enzyme S subunit
MRTGWTIKTVSEVATHSLGKMLDKAKNQGDPKPYLRNFNVRWFDFDLSDVQEMRFQKEEQDRYSIIKGDLVICEGGYPGRAAIWDKDEPVYFQKALHRVRFNEPERAKWLLYYLYAKDLDGSLKRHFNGAGIQHFTGEALAQFKLPLPSLGEQHRIVAILDEAFEGIATAKANTEKNLQNARAIFESHLQSVLSQRGAGWVEKRLDEICTFSSGGTPSKQNASYWAGKIPWISGRDMKSTRLSDSYLHISKAAVEESATRMAPPGTLLILVRGMGLAHGAQIGELMVPSAFNQDIRGIHPTPELLPRYLLFALRDGINSSDTVLSNAAHGTLKIDSNELQKVMIPFPPLKQQQRIVATIDTLVEESENLAKIYERKLAALDALKQSLLHRAFAGELTVGMPSELIEAVA